MSTPKQYIRRYESISDFAAYCGSIVNYSPTGHDCDAPTGCASHSSRSHSWDYGQSFDAALDMGLSGGNWDEGAQQLQAVSIDSLAHGMADVIEPAIVHDVHGGGLDIGEYLADNPECFFRLDEIEQPKPIVRIGVCTVPCANIEAHQLINHGRAIIALVEALELQQYSVELTGMFIAAGNHKRTYIAETVVKQAGQPWDAASVAYALCHPAYSRRLGFAALEADDDCHHYTGEGYGDGRIKAPEGYDLYFRYLDRPSAVNTPEAAQQYVTDIVTQQQPDLIKRP